MSRPPFLAIKPREVGTPKAVVADLYNQHGGVKRVMVKLQTGKTQTYAWADPQASDEISFASVAALTEPGKTAAAEFLSLLGGGVFLPISPEDADLNTLCADDMRAHGEALAVLVDALRGGKLENGARSGALLKIDAALRTLTGLRAAVVEETTEPPA